MKNNRIETKEEFLKYKERVDKINEAVQTKVSTKEVDEDAITLRKELSIEAGITIERGFGSVLIPVVGEKTGEYGKGTTVGFSMNGIDYAIVLPTSYIIIEDKNIYVPLWLIKRNGLIPKWK